tara:strand:- start:898 stop:1116 length:219 start_codon:yes stop_codon:yes gene_type:complete
MDIVDQLKYAGDHVLFVPHLYHSAADTIEQLQSTIKMQASDISLLRLANSVLRSERNRMKKENRELKGKKRL